MAWQRRRLGCAPQREEREQVCSIRLRFIIQNLCLGTPPSLFAHFKASRLHNPQHVSQDETRVRVGPLIANWPFLTRPRQSASPSFSHCTALRFFHPTARLALSLTPLLACAASQHLRVLTTTANTTIIIINPGRRHGFCPNRS